VDGSHEAAGAHAPARHAARRALACALAAGGVAASACGARAARAQPDSADVARLGALGARVERDTASLLGAARLAARPAAERQAWERYVAASRAMRAADRAACAASSTRSGWRRC
jgi:hypothetical protein